MAFALALWLVSQDPLDAEVRTIGRIDLAPIDDAGFLKRLTRDLLGREATPAETAAFVGDPDKGKRRAAIDRFVGSPEFDAAWAARFTRLLFGDPERVRIEPVAQLPADYGPAIVKRFEEWFAVQLRKDRPYGEIVFDLINSRGNPADEPAAAYKLSLFGGLGFPQEFALSVSRRFLGIRLGCARCHDHPYDRWRSEDFHGLAAIAARGRSRVKNQAGAFDHVRFLESDAGDYVMPGGKVASKPAYPYGGAPGQNDGQFEWLGHQMKTSGQDQLERVLVNRAWAWLTGRGIQEPADDFSKMTVPVSATLLKLLATDFRDHKGSIRHLARTICRTELYQRAGEGSWRVTTTRRNSPLGGNAPALPIVFDAPASWVRWPPRSDFKFLLRLPDKEKSARDAELGITSIGAKEPSLQGPLNQWILQIACPAIGKTESPAGMGKILLVEVAGTYACDIDSDVPEDERVILASVASGDKVYNFRLQGPRETVDDWRDDFLKLLKDLRPK